MSEKDWIDWCNDSGRFHIDYVEDYLQRLENDLECLEEHIKHTEMELASLRDVEEEEPEYPGNDVIVKKGISL